MPGAYEKKHFYSEIAARVSENVSYANELLKQGQLAHMVASILPQITNSLLPTKSSVEDFYYAGGLHLLCDILLEISHETYNGNPDMLAIPILQEFMALLCKEYETFDDDIGDIPLLVYFLCERHKYYVDINWNFNELNLMEKYINAHLSLLALPPKQNDSYKQGISSLCRKMALESLFVAIRTFPSHRVVSRMAHCFHNDGCKKIEIIFQHLKASNSTVSLLCKFSQLLESIISFGLGKTLATDILTSQLLLATSFSLRKNARCPCKRCELLRRLQKIGRERDEFGVIEANEAKKYISTAFIRFGGLNILQHMLKEMCGRIQSSSITGCTDFDSVNKDEFEANMESFDQFMRSVSVIILLSSWSYPHCSDNHCILQGNDGKLLEEILACIQLQESLQNNRTLNTTRKGRENLISVLCALILKEEDNNVKLDILKIVHPFLSNFVNDMAINVVESSGQLSRNFAPALGYSMPLFCALMQLEIFWKFENFKSSSKHTEQEKIQSDCSSIDHHFQRVTDEIKTNKTTDCASAVNQNINRLSTENLKGNNFCEISPKNSQGIINTPKTTDELTNIKIETPEHASKEETTSTNDFIRSAQSYLTQQYVYLSPEIFKNFVLACQCFFEGYQYAGVLADERSFLAALISSMANLVGGMEYACLSDARRYFMPPPHTICGWFAKAGKELMDLYNVSSPREGCAYVNEVCRLVIARAEKASAVLKWRNQNPV